MSRYLIHKYVNCDKNEFKAMINHYKKRGYTIEKRETVQGYFVVAILYGEEKYIAFEETEE